jgi:hypothetical protein
MFKNSVRTAKKTQHFTNTKINWLTLFEETISVYTENHTKHITTVCGKNADVLSGTYSYHWALKGGVPVSKQHAVKMFEGLEVNFHPL